VGVADSEDTRIYAVGGEGKEPGSRLRDEAGPGKEYEPGRRETEVRSFGQRSCVGRVVDMGLCPEEYEWHQGKVVG